MHNVVYIHYLRDVKIREFNPSSNFVRSTNRKMTSRFRNIQHTFCCVTLYKYCIYTTNLDRICMTVKESKSIGCSSIKQLRGKRSICILYIMYILCILCTYTIDVIFLGRYISLEYIYVFSL